MGYKMVFSDMDGTLLWKGVRVSVENSAAIRKAVDKGVEAFRHLFLRCRSMQEADQNDRLNRVERVEAAHQTRLDAGDKKFDKLSADMAQLLKVQNALLMHEITGNGIEKLKTVKSELDTYLATRN